MTRRAAVYCRISLDRAGASLGVQRQEEDCRELAERNGWPVAEVYVDNDVSAYSGKPRPAWQRLIADVGSGAIDALVCWHVDRLTRSPRELEDVIDLADKHGLSLATVTGEVDLATPTGRMVARMLGAAARHESEHKAERQRRQARQSAEAGRVHGGVRPFGYEPDRITVVESEAAVIRECAARLLAGESLRSITGNLNHREITTVTGKPWTTTTVRGMMASARISGRREHTPTAEYRGKRRPLLGEIVADVAVWPAIITPQDSDRLRSLLTRPERRTTPGTARKTMLSGVLVCGRCGMPMASRPRSGVPRYVCYDHPGRGGCGKATVTGARADDRVRDLVLSVLDDPKLAERLRCRDNPEPDLHERIRADEDRLAELAADHGAGEITRAEWKAARAPVAARIEAAHARLARTSQTSALDGFIGPLPEMERKWQDMNTSQRRAIVTAVMESITVRPGTSNRFDPGRFIPRYRA